MTKSAIGGPPTIIIDGAIVLDQPTGPEIVFSVGDLVIPTIRIPFVRPAFCGQECRVVSVDNGKVYATLTKWARVPAWPFLARELVLIQGPN